MRTSQKFLFSGILFLGMLAFAVVGEALIRLYLNQHILYDIEMTKYASVLKMPSSNPKIGHVHKPNHSAHLMGVDVHINSDGLRDVEHEKGSTDKHRIVFLGDSLTFGWGVEQNQTFKTLIEKKLNEVRPTEIVNFGAGNYNTEQEASLFFEKGPDYSPQEVILFYFINDAEPTPARSRWSFLEHSRLISFYWSRINLLLGKWGGGVQFKNFYSNLYRDELPGWQSTAEALKKLAQYCKEKGISFKVVLLPELHQLEPYPFVEEHNKVKRVLAKEQVPFLDVIEKMDKSLEPEKLWVSLDDAHPNAIAHEIIAKHVIPFLTDGGTPHANHQAKN